MSTLNNNDFIIDNGTGQQVRLDIQNAFQQLARNNSGANPPVTTDTPPAQVAFPHQWFANTTSGKLMYKDASTGNNATLNYFNLAKLTGGLSVDQPSDFNGDVVFNGTDSSGSFDITFDADDSSGRGALIFKDETKIRLGTGNDFGMVHQTNLNIFSALTDTRTVLTTRTNNAGQECFLLQTQDSSDTDSAYKAFLNGRQELFFNGSSKFKTTANGIEVAGSVTVTAQPACLLINPVDINVTSSDEDTPLKFATQQTNVGCTVNSDKDRITVPISGTYLITACISGEKTNHTSNDSNDNILKILKNGSDAVNNSAFPRHPFGTSSSEPFSFFINMPLVLSANDYLEICLDDFNAATASVKFGYFSVTKLN